MFLNGTSQVHATGGGGSGWWGGGQGQLRHRHDEIFRASRLLGAVAAHEDSREQQGSQQTSRPRHRGVFSPILTSDERRPNRAEN
jgi:hypothetical protein